MTIQYLESIEHIDGLSLILEALSFASEKHRNQRRKDVLASPYINHPIALARTLKVEGGVTDPLVLSAAILHDTIEDTATSYEELEAVFGPTVASMVLEVSDDKSLPKAERKRLQIEHAHQISPGARLVKLADKICNLRDVTNSPPAGWSEARKEEYCLWCKQVVDNLRGCNPRLEAVFDEVYASAPRGWGLAG